MELDSKSAPWNSDTKYSDGNLGHRVGPKQFYFPVAPIDATHDIRSDMLMMMGKVGLPIEKHHHEVASCQCELGISYSDLVSCADNIMTFKYVVKNVAKQHNKTATFMPKPLFGDNGSGMHVHMSLWKDGQNLFYDQHGKYLRLSQICLWYIGGLLEHSPSILAFSNPTTNSYKRLIPGFEAPSNLVYSGGNRSAAVRVPLYRPTCGRSKRIEYRCPDPSCCPYLAFAAMLLAGLDGIKRKLSPGDPCDKDMFELTPEEKKKIKSTPAGLSDVLCALENDMDYLLEGGVFTRDFILAYIKFKRSELHSVESVPHPKEFELYYQC
eukprot:GHVR01178723.1.p1 GENE.GHVR01178723.1~~GHVR01178723.1.p1  ORF type:complete len:324 (+),score=66.51 GHVR01178723.1:633-1604(+)